MKTNQTFSIKRFGKYIISNLTLTYRQTLLMWGALAVSIFLISLFALYTNSHNWHEGHITMFVIISFIAGILYASFSFSSFRRKEKTTTSLMLPITAFERFLYEFVEKFIVFIILYPIVFSLFSNFAVFIRNTFHTPMETVNGLVTSPFKYFQVQEVFKNNQDGVTGFLISLGLLLFTLVFAGSATFRKYPLVKTIVFVGVIILTIIGYFYMLVAKIKLDDPWIAGILEQSTVNQRFKLMSLVFILFSLVALTFAFFKVKEKEVS
jgi:hypothetical protein